MIASSHDRPPLLLSLAAIFAGHPVFAADEPDVIIAAIYKRIVGSFNAERRTSENGVFTWGRKKDRHHYYSASLVKAWDHAEAITAVGDQRPPAADPMTNSQDSLVRAFDVVIERRDKKSATVIAHISQDPGLVKPSDWGTIAYDMVFERGRWRIDDIRHGVGKDAWSLRREIVNHKG